MSLCPKSGLDMNKSSFSEQEGAARSNIDLAKPRWSEKKSHNKIMESNNENQSNDDRSIKEVTETSEYVKIIKEITEGLSKPRFDYELKLSDLTSPKISCEGNNEPIQKCNSTWMKKCPGYKATLELSHKKKIKKEPKKNLSFVVAVSNVRR